MQAHALLFILFLSLLSLSRAQVPNQAHMHWVVTELHTDEECESLMYAHLQVMGTCYKYGGRSNIYKEENNGMQYWKCSDSHCGNCTLATENILITDTRICTKISDSESSSENSEFMEATYKTNTYVISFFPDSFDFPSGTIEKNYEVQFDSTTNCSGNVTAVDVQPLWCFEGCKPPNQVFCDIPPFLRSSPKDLTRGAIAGIVIATILVVTLMIVGGVFYYIRKHRQESNPYSEQFD